MTDPPADRETVWLTFGLFALLLATFGGAVALGAPLLVQIPFAAVVLFFGFVFHVSVEDYHKEKEKHD